MLMTNPEISLDEALKKAKKIVDTAFENYPDKPLCNMPLKERKGVSKAGKPYHFWGCTGFPKCKYTWNPPAENSTNDSTSSQPAKVTYKTDVFEQKVINELSEIKKYVKQLLGFEE